MESTTKEGLDIDDDDEKKKLEECKAEFEPLTKLMKEILGGKTDVKGVADSDDLRLNISRDQKEFREEVP